MNDELEESEPSASAYTFDIAVTSRGWFIGQAMEWPLVLARGRSREECADRLAELIASAMTRLRASGRDLPAPGVDLRRRENGLPLGVPTAVRRDNMAQRQDSRRRCRDR